MIAADRAGVLHDTPGGGPHARSASYTATAAAIRILPLCQRGFVHPASVSPLQLRRLRDGRDFGAVTGGFGKHVRVRSRAVSLTLTMLLAELPCPLL